MTCNFCGNPFHWDEKCLMNPEFEVTAAVPIKFYVQLKLNDVKLEKEIFDRWIQRLQMEMEFRK